MKQLTVEVPGPHPSDETAVRRSYLSRDGLITRAAMLDHPSRGIDALLRPHNIQSPPKNTVYELMVFAAFKHAGRTGIGYRDIVDIKYEVKDGKTLSVYELSPYHWIDTDTFEKAAWRLGHQLKTVVGYGDRKPGSSSPRRLLLFANSSHEWTMTAHACFSQGISIATIFTALGVDGLTTSSRECEPLAIFTTPEFLPIVVDTAAAGKLPKCLRTAILATGDNPVVPENDKDRSKVQSLCDRLKGLGWNIVRFSELVGSLSDVGDIKPPMENAPTENDEAVIMYTSGTTGDPKGILLTHGSISATVAGAERHLGPDLKTRLSEVSTHYTGGTRSIKANEQDVDVYMAFLPTSHILEFAVVHVLFFLGCPLGTARIRTLLSSTVPGCKPDIQELRPTIMAGVPTIWERIRKQVAKTLSTQPPVVQNMFAAAVAAKQVLNNYDPFPLVLHPSWSLNWYTPTNLMKSAIDSTIFAKVRAVTGGRLRACLSGGAPIAPDTRKWMSNVICPVLIGYGLTENCAVTTIDELDHVFTDDQRSVGGLAPHIEMKLVDYLEGGYRAAEGRGEIWTRGPSVMREYFKRPELTAETITPDGWLKTGDIGEWLPDGSLMIIDRKKNLIKLSHGEYIAVERLEAIYSHSRLVHNICLYADPTRDFAIAIVVPDEKELRKLFPAEDPRSFHDLCKDAGVRALALKSLQVAGKESKLAPAEIVKGVILDSEEWTVENGVMTPSSKVKRREVEKKYRQEIATVYNT